MKYLYAIFLLLLNSSIITAQYPSTKVQPEITTYLGNSQRNYYGNTAPSRLDTIWKLYLGEGISPAYGNPNRVWKGAGWTGQPLLIIEDGKPFLIHGAFDYHLRKIDALTGDVVWKYEFDDIIKGTGTVWHNTKARTPEEEYIIIQGSRRGVGNTIHAKYCPSLRGISYLSGKELWRLNVKETLTYSRDVDGSAITFGDTSYLALENGLFTVFSSDPELLEMKDGFMQPKIYKEILYYQTSDTTIHGGNIESESSPCIVNNHIYTTAGSGRVYGYNISTGIVDWVFEIGSDLDGSPVVTSDSCLIIAIEKQFINGKGGVLKLDPCKSPDKSVVWYYPTNDTSWYHWEGGIIGSVAINDYYNPDTSANICAFIGVDGYLNVVNHKKLASGSIVKGPDGVTGYPSPELVFRTYTGGTISTPIIVGNKLIAALDKGLLLYEYDKAYNFTLLDELKDLPFDATPIVWDGRLYVASCNGYLYCFGEKK